MTPPDESTPRTLISELNILAPGGAGVESGRDGIGGANIALTVAALIGRPGYGRFVTTKCCDCAGFSDTDG